MMKLKFILGIFVMLTSLAAQAATGFKVRSFSSSPLEENVASIFETTYVGQCPGVVRTTPEAWFTSDRTQTASGQRVRIDNVTPGMNPSPYPFTDREYSNGLASEHTWFQVDSIHHGRAFSVNEGENKLRFVIYSGARIVEEGSFSLDVVITENKVRRDMECHWESRCNPLPSGGSNCAQEWVCRCPNY